MNKQAVSPVISNLRVECCGNQESPHLPLVFIHGWGSDSRIWKPLISFLEKEYSIVLLDLPGYGNNADIEITTLEVLYDAIVDVIPDQCHVVGWSLGGMIATCLVDRFPTTFKSLTTIACNAKFTSDADWSAACPNSVYQKFLKGFENDTVVTLQRFAQLQGHGDGERKKVVQFLRSATGDCEDFGWLTTLKWLDEIDNRDILRGVTFPHLAIFGENDALVPNQASESIRRLNPRNKVCLIADAGHAPHISNARQCAQRISSFVCASENPFDRNKLHVAQSFSAAAKSYDWAAALQRKVADELLSLKQNYGGVICDIGCGTGFCLDTIAKGESDVVGLDIAPGMLAQCQEKYAGRSIRLVQADFDALPFADRAFDGLVSSMSLQWSSDAEKVFVDARRVLREEGWFLFSTLGPKTLYELQSAWNSVDEYIHVNNFESPERYLALLDETGFAVEHYHQKSKIVYYDNVIGLMRDLKSIGAHNVNAGKNRATTTRGKLKSLDSAYENFREGGKLPATYDVLFFLAKVRSN